MDMGVAIQLVRSGIIQILVISAPVLIIGMVVGLIISIFQATTSIQEQTLTFVPKIAAILAALIFFGPWMFGAMVQFTQNVFAQIPNMIR